MSKLQLSPMLVQYLVGLCCLRWHPDSVDVTIGDMIRDSAAEKDRDVDVTVTITEAGNITHAFKAYEVKHESKPIDVAGVEQLAIKLSDMDSVTHKAIVSASGFTSSAIRKAAKHGITLYEIQPWTRPLQEQFPALTMRGKPEECFPTTQTLLHWIDWKYYAIVNNAKRPFSIELGDKIYHEVDGTHVNFKDFGAFIDDVCLRSTEILVTQEPAQTILRTFPVPFFVSDGTVPAGPAWPHTHTLDVSQDNVYLETEQGRLRVDLITINGFLQWQRSGATPIYCVMQELSSREAFAGAIIATELRDGHMKALVFSPKTCEIGIHFVRLAEKHLVCIRDLKVDKYT